MNEIQKGILDWREKGIEYGYVMPKVAWWKRLPVIRHIRTIKAAIAVEWHYSYGMGSIGIRTGYDDWILWGMWRGLEGVKE